MSSTSQTPGDKKRWEDDRDAAAGAVNRETQAAKSAASNAKDTIRDEASNLASEAKQKAYEGAEQGMSAAASSLDDFTAAIRKASDELGNRDQSMAANLVREAASGLEQASNAIKGQSVQDLTRSVAGFARRQPAAFLIGATLAGVALGRFARASGEHSGTGTDYKQGGFGGSSRNQSGSPQPSGFAASNRSSMAGDRSSDWRSSSDRSASDSRSSLAAPAVITGDNASVRSGGSGSTAGTPRSTPYTPGMSGLSGTPSAGSSARNESAATPGAPPAGPNASELGKVGSSGTTGTAGLSTGSSPSHTNKTERDDSKPGGLGGTSAKGPANTKETGNER